jgi:excisionase family DNA binding protein
MRRSHRDPALLTTAGVASVVGVSKRTVIRMVDAGEIPVALRTPAGHARIRLAVAEALRDGDAGPPDEAA